MSLSHRFDWNDSRLKRRYRSLLATLREQPRLRLFVLVAFPFAMLTVFFVLPLVIMLAFSFFAEIPRSVLSPPAVTLENYVKFLTTDLYLNVILQTTVITLQTTVVVVVLGYLLAYSIVRFPKRTSLFLVLIILPYWTNYIVRMYAWINILQTGGVLDTILLAMNLVQEPVGLLYSHEAVLIGFIYIYLPLATLPFYASLINLNPNLIDAAKDLGAGPFEAFFTVTLPMTLDGIVVGVILVMIPIYGAFITPQMLGGTNNIMIGMVIEQQFNQAFNWPFGAALGMVVTFIVLALLLASLVTGSNVLGGDRT